MTRAKKRELREFVVRANIKLVGACTIVEAYDEDDARNRVIDGGGFDTDCAELVDWTVTSVEPND